MSPWSGGGSSCPGWQRHGDCGADAARAHIELVAAVLSRNGPPDLMALQEVEGCDVLRTVADALARGAGGAEYDALFVKGRDTYTGQNVAVLARRGLGAAGAAERDERREAYGCGYAAAEMPTSGVSKHLIARFDVEGLGRVSLVVVHLKAFPTDARSCAQREAQAAVVQAVVRSEMAAGNEVIVLGDFNDYIDSPPDARDSAPRSRVLRMLSSDVDGDEACCGDGDLFPIVDEEAVPKAERYTSVYDMDDSMLAGPPAAVVDRRSSGKLSQIDHILATRGIKDRVRRVWIDHEHNPDLVSDHWPVFVELDLAQGNATASGILPAAPSPAWAAPGGEGGEGGGATGAAIALIAVVVSVLTVIASVVAVRWRRRCRGRGGAFLVDGAFNPLVYEMQAKGAGAPGGAGHELVALSAADAGARGADALCAG